MMRALGIIAVSAVLAIALELSIGWAWVCGCPLFRRDTIAHF